MEPQSPEHPCSHGYPRKGHTRRLTACLQCQPGDDCQATVGLSRQPFPPGTGATWGGGWACWVVGVGPLRPVRGFCSIMSVTPQLEQQPGLSREDFLSLWCRQQSRSPEGWCPSQGQPQHQGRGAPHFPQFHGSYSLPAPTLLVGKQREEMCR